MNKKQKKMLKRIVSAAAVFALALVLYRWKLISIGLLLVSYAVAGYDVLYKALRGTLRGDLFDENFLMALATVSAVITGEYHEAVFVMVFYQTGELFQSVAVGKSRRSIAELMQIRPDRASLETENGIVETDPSSVRVGDIVLVKPGEKIPLDGVVTEGSTEINTSALTGESLPRFAGEGDTVVSGCVNISGTVRVRVTKEFSESTVSRILKLTENAASQKAKAESIITRFARVYTPAVVVIALLLAVLPPLFLGIVDFAVWKTWIYRAMTLLVISCPCALVISVPLSFFSGIGALSRRGVLVKGGSHIETLAKCTTVIFDKTGTLTEGDFKVDAVLPEGMTETELVSLAATAEYYSDHPLARAVKNYGAKGSCPDSAEEIPGMGIVAKLGDGTIAAGNEKLMDKLGIRVSHIDETAVHIARNGVYAGCILFEDKIKPTAPSAIEALPGLGVKNIVMLTGDKSKTAEKVASKIGIKDVRSELMPGDKLEITQKIIENTKDGKVAFVGDGINDAPTLARADVGIAMGKLGTEAASEAADVVLMDDDPAKIGAAIRQSRKTVAIVMQNILLVLTVKIAAIILGALGIAGMWAAVFADVGVAVLAILNSMRNK